MDEQRLAEIEGESAMERLAEGLMPVVVVDELGPRPARGVGRAGHPVGGARRTVQPPERTAAPQLCPGMGRGHGQGQRRAGRQGGAA